MRLRLSPILLGAAMFFAALGVAKPVQAQQADVIRGRVIGRTAFRSSARTSPSRRSPATYSRRPAPTRDGRFTVTFPGGEGDYFVNVAALGFAAKRFEVKRTGDQEILVADAKLTRVGDGARRRSKCKADAAEGVAQRRGARHQRHRAAASRPAPSPPTSWATSPRWRRRSPACSSIPGADGDPNGFSVLGLGADQNSDDAQRHELRRIEPAARRERLDVARHDAVRRVARRLQRRAAQRAHAAAARTSSRASTSLNFDAPQLQWTDPAARALGQQYTNLSLGGALAGPISVRQGVLQHRVSARPPGERPSDVCSTPIPLGLQAAGVAARFGHAACSTSSAGAARPDDGRRHPEQPPQRQGARSSAASTSRRRPRRPARRSTSRSTAAGTGRRRPAALTTELPAHSGERTNWSGGVQGTAHELLRLRHPRARRTLGVERLAQLRRRRISTCRAARVRVNSTFADGTSERADARRSAAARR